VGKARPNASIWVNNTMRQELLWFIHFVKVSNGIHMLKSVEWSPYDRMASTLIGYADTSGSSMGIWFSGKYTGYQCVLPPEGRQDLIFYYEVLAVCSAFYLGLNYACNHIAIYSDDTNTVDMSSSLWAKPVYNSILVAAVDFAVECSISTKVYYVLGKQNIIANFLSRFQNVKALQLALNMHIQLFQPPWNVLGVVKK
jgi:hypothetical protein